MALTQTTTVDLVGSTQTISFFTGVTLVDQITFSSNALTFQAISSYSLSKSDFALYFQYLNAFFFLIQTNFPSTAAQFRNILPLSNFQISETFAGVKHITYNQTSQGTTVMNINYVPSVVSAAFTARASPVTITIQEFYLMINQMYQYANQVALN
jgi:hypothetical protein